MCYLCDCKHFLTSPSTFHGDARHRSPVQKHQDETKTAQKSELLTACRNMQYTLVYHLIIPKAEINYVECQEELMLQKASRQTSSNLEDTKLVENDIKCEGAKVCRRNCCAGSLVLETGSVHNVATDCSEEELVYNADVDDKAMTTACYIRWSRSQIDSEEECGISTNNCLSSASMERSAPQPHSNITLYEKPVSRDVRVFVSEDDGISHSESSFGHFPSHRRDVNYSNHSYKARIVGNSELADAYSKSDKPQDNQLTFPCAKTSDGPDKNATVIKGNSGFAIKHYTIVTGFEKIQLISTHSYKYLEIATDFNYLKYCNQGRETDSYLHEICHDSIAIYNPIIHQLLSK